MSDSVLNTRDLTVQFGGIRAVNSVSLSCRAGQLTGLIGPNGAGKTTFVDAITGFLPKNTTGSIELDGEEVSGLAAHRLANRGLTRTWQTLELFDDISVRSNLAVASHRLTFTGAVRDYFHPSRAEGRVDEVIDTLGLGSIVDRKPRELSQGQLKLVGVGRALASSSTRILLLDEPAAGLDKNETAWFGAQLRNLVSQGYTLLLIDHDMGLVLNVCDYVHMLVYGELVVSGPPETMRSHPEVIGAYLGHRERA